MLYVINNEVYGRVRQRRNMAMHAGRDPPISNFKIFL